MGTRIRVGEATKLFLVDTVWILLTVVVLVFLTGITYLTLSGQDYKADTIRWTILLIASLVAAPSVYLLKRGSDSAWGRKADESRDDGSKETISVPLLGPIATGEPVPVLDNDSLTSGHGTVRLTRDMCGDQPGVYALQARGNSLIDALINDGDIVIIRHEQAARDGDMVVVWLKDEQFTTLKRFYHEGDKIRLQPENPTMAAIYVSPSNIEIQGRVVGVIRRIEPAHSSPFGKDSHIVKV
ncbi:MAG: LexA family protein [Anaerolineae bacterium]